MSRTFQVTMLDVLREPFEQWLASRGLLLAHIPDTDPDVFIVVPGPELQNARILEAVMNGEDDDATSGWVPCVDCGRLVPVDGQLRSRHVCY